jgi:hypothetical protein
VAALLLAVAWASPVAVVAGAEDPAPGRARLQPSPELASANPETGRARLQPSPEPAGTNPGAAEFFEKEVRPLLADKCQKCHGGPRPRAGLSLTGRDPILTGGDSGPAAVPGRPRDSLILQAVEQRGELKMPPKGKLSDAEVDRLRRWIERGLPWPAAHAGSPAGPSGAPPERAAPRPWWAFQPLQAGPPPAVRDAAWPRSEIDRFLLAELEARGLRPARPADRRTLIRRATFDLTGLPPTPEEVDAFLGDESPAAFTRVVDRLLASPAYGQRWARHWLDVVRYTDYFYPDPNAHPRAALFELFEAWRYRDWVVAALNRDMPYDRFIVHQIAGDLLPGPDAGPVYPEGIVATGLLALSVFDNGDADKLKILTDIVDDEIDVIGKAFLGLTLACARCHDHKFDPIPQRDYYGLAGIFHSTRILAEVGGVGDHTVALRVPLVPKSYLQRRDRQLKQLGGLEALAKGLGRLRDLEAGLERLADSWRTAALGSRASWPASLPCAKARAITARASAALEYALTRIAARRDALRKELLPEPPRALAAQDGGTPGGMFTGIQDVPVHVRGSYTRLGQVVPRHLPGVFGEGPVPITQGSGRLDLARWIARPDNPMTARVLVNRVWQHHFGAGIVRTPSNFGKLGEPPSHPRLLDWLADRFLRDGWSIKRLHRRILLSSAYQQASVADPESLRIDPENRWLGRMNPRRLEAEAIRDTLLAVAGRLDRTPGGPATGHLDRPRRSLYIQTVRQDRGNFSTLFDAANPEQSVEGRSTSTVAPQALFLVNSPFVQAQARHLARRLIERVPGDDAARIDRAYRCLFGRPPRAEEVEIGRSFLAHAAARGPDAAWFDYAHLLLCSNELIYVD